MSIYTLAILACLLLVVPCLTDATQATPIVTSQIKGHNNQTQTPILLRATRSARRENSKTCFVQVCVQKQVQGTCVRFGDRRQGVPACSAGQYLDIHSDQCVE